ncbi:Deoxyhypusine hydroxylase-like protein [Drosera capensis]
MIYHIVPGTQAAEALDAIGLGSSNIPPLEKRLVLDPAPDVRETCELALQRIKELNNFATVSKEVSPSPFLSVAAPASHSSVAELRDVLLDQEKAMYERYAALFALRNHGGDEAVSAIIASLGAESALLRHEEPAAIPEGNHNIFDLRLKLLIFTGSYILKTIWIGNQVWRLILSGKPWQKSESAVCQAEIEGYCTWEHMKAKLRKHFLPADYTMELYEKFHCLKRHNNSVEEYTTEFNNLSIRFGLTETNEQLMSRYLIGLNYSIRDEMGVVSFQLLRPSPSQAVLKLRSDLRRPGTPASFPSQAAAAEISGTSPVSFPDFQVLRHPSQISVVLKPRSAQLQSSSTLDPVVSEISTFHDGDFGYCHFMASPFFSGPHHYAAFGFLSVTGHISTDLHGPDRVASLFDGFCYFTDDVPSNSSAASLIPNVSYTPPRVKSVVTTTFSVG